MEPTLSQLRALRELLRQCSVSGAARRLDVSQPSLSRSLGQLRQVLDDELLVRVGSRMRRTAKGEALLGPLDQALRQLDEALRAQATFDPDSSTRIFRIAAVDYLHATVGSAFAKVFEREAPNCRLVLTGLLAALDPGHEDEALAGGRLDAVLSPPRPSQAGVVWRPLLEESYTTVFDPKAAAAPKRLADFVQRPQVVVAPWGQSGSPVDEALAARGRSRRVVCELSTFALVPHVLIGTGRVCTLPSRMAAQLVSTTRLRAVKTPLQIPPFSIGLAWHERMRNDPAHRWLREQLAAAVQEVKRVR